MQYRYFDGGAELKKRISTEEQRHYLTQLEFRMAEIAGEDEKLEPLRKKLQEIEQHLALLHKIDGK